MTTRPRDPPPSDRELVPLLEECRCKIFPGEGTLCQWCGSHGRVLAHKRNDACEVVGCGHSTPLLECGGCNIAFHEGCVEHAWGLDKDGEEMAWCEECHDEWKEFGVATSSSEVRGGMTIGYDPDNRPVGPEPGTLPPLMQKRGRKKTRVERARKELPDLARCTARNCKLGCDRISTEQRQEMRDHFQDLLSSTKTGSRRRAMDFVFQFMKKEKQTISRQHLASHPEAKDGATVLQKCQHCKQDPREKWDPPQNHAYRTCRRRAEPLNGTTYKTVYRQHDGEGSVVVHKEFSLNQRT